MSTTVITPERSREQRMEALARANDIRSRRAQMKRDVKAGQESARLLLAAPPLWLASAKVADLLLALPKYGRVKVHKTLKRAEISPSKSIGGLSQRQRSALVGLLERG